MNKEVETVIVTGGAGFIGSHFVHLLLKKGYHVVNIDNLSYASNATFLEQLAAFDRHEFIKADIRDRDEISKILKNFKPDIIVNFAAESHVDRSIINPSGFLDVNTNGVSNLLECVRDYNEKNKLDNYLKFVQISTDEVYGERFQNNPASEDSILSPSNVYSASKAAADLLVLAYFKTYGLPVVITRCCNNYGERQHEEKLIPKIIKSLNERTVIPIYGSGDQVRQWIHVSDHVSAIEAVMNSGSVGRIWNVGDANYVSNLQLTKYLCDHFDRKRGLDASSFNSLVRHVEDRRGHDYSYSITSKQFTHVFDWHPKIKFEEGLDSLVG